MCDYPHLCDEENCVALELERACYNEMERESMEYFRESQKKIRRLRKRIRTLEKVLTANGISITEED